MSFSSIMLSGLVAAKTSSEVTLMSKICASKC